MKAAIFEVIFSLGARTLGFENKGAIFSNIAPLFLRAPRGKEFESGPFIGGKLGLNMIFSASLRLSASALNFYFLT
jgi:hypothetical protein